MEKFKKLGIQLVGISYDNVDVLKKFADSQEITFPLLADKGSATIRALGIEDRNGLPHSGTILVDKENRVRGKVFYDGYRKRHSNEELMEAAKSLGLAE